jgi:fatty acid amide hydrolase 2
MKTAREIASLIRNSEKTVTQTVEEHISQIEKVNPSINAVVETRYEKALMEAETKDKILAKMSSSERENLPPLFGVPFTCKEMIANQGMKSTLGSLHHKNRVMEKDATVVRRVKDAGAVLLGTTNVPEIGFWFECDNVVYGATKNPFDITRTSGGSSGGEGAIISTGASPFGLGSDLGGSIRLPAAFCGIFGHKPSDRVVPLTGHYPLDGKEAREITGSKYPFTVIGPLARSASDLELLFRLMIGPDETDQNIKSDFKLLPLVKNCESLKIYYLPSPVIHATTETESDLAQVIRHAARYFKEMGSQVEEENPRLFLRAMEFWSARIWSIDGKAFSELLGGGQNISYPKEFMHWLLRKRKYTLPSILTGLVEQHFTDRSQMEESLQGLMQLKKALSRKLGKDGVLLMPVHPRKAPELDSTYLRPFDFAYTGIINALGFPSTAVPMGMSADGLPLSLQVIAAEDQDHLCLSVAQLLETGFGGWRAPSLALQEKQKT